MPAMSRISAIASDRIQQEKKLLIPYLVAGDPDLPTTLTLMKELVQQGADIIELGIPFSDPASDGPVIQRGVERALNGGTTLRDTLALVAQFREGDTETGIVLMGYLNPIEIMGYENFAGSAAAAGVDGVPGGGYATDGIHGAASQARSGRHRHDISRRANDFGGARKGHC